jgi:hypothetical protein
MSEVRMRHLSGNVTTVLVCVVMSEVRMRHLSGNVTSVLVCVVMSEVRMRHLSGNVTFVPNFANCLFLKNGVFWDVTPCGSCKNLAPPSSG